MSPVRILPKIKTRKSNKNKEAGNDHWDNRQYFDASLHIPNTQEKWKPGHKQIGSTHHQAKLGQPGKVKKIGDD